MDSQSTDAPGIWTVAEAKARLSHILRRAEEEGTATNRHSSNVRGSSPSGCGSLTRRLRFPWDAGSSRTCRATTNLELPDRSSARDIPFFDWSHDET